MTKDENENRQGKVVGIEKAPSGIKGLDEICEGGLPAGRATLICGGPGCGKTLLSMEFIINGISRYGENGAFVSFEESGAELAENVSSLGFDIDRLLENGQLNITDIPFHPQARDEIGRYDLGGLLAIIGHAIDSVGATRVVIDGIEAVFSFFQNESIIRHELKRLMAWLKERGVTALITSERGEGSMLITRHGIEEYVSDCVILLDQRVVNQVAVRRLKIVKYRGTYHGTNEYPFLVTRNGISIFPVTSMLLDYQVRSERVSTGIAGLDSMLSGEGYHAGSSILISGTSGTGKSSLAAHFADSLCRENKQCLYFAFEEPASQIIRNMQSIGLDLSRHVDEGTLEFVARRPTEYGIEEHLLRIHDTIASFNPDAVIFDPLSNLTDVAAAVDVKSMFARILNYIKNNGITALSTNLIHGGESPQATEIGISSIMDTWIVLRIDEQKNRKMRHVDIVKSRGMEHSEEIYGFRITGDGLVIDKE